MRIRHRGLLVSGMLLVAACSSGGATEPLPLETAPPVTAAPTTDDSAPSTEPREAAEVTVADETTTTAVPEPTATVADDPGGPVEVFREAAAAFNEVELNPQDESIRPAAYELMTERFRADRAFEVNTGDPQFLNPWKDLVVLGAPDIDDSGEVATFWYCQRELDPDPDSGLDISAVWRARMELVDGQWRWAARDVLGRSDEEVGCPDGGATFVPVADDVREQVEGAAVGYFDAQRLAVEDPRNSALVDDLLRRSGGTVREKDDRLLAQTIELDLVVLRDASAPTAARLLGAHQLPNGEVRAFVCQPDNTKAVRPGDDPDEQSFVNRSIFWDMSFTESGDAWIVVSRELIVDWQFSGTCEPL